MTHGTKWSVLPDKESDSTPTEQACSSQRLTPVSIQLQSRLGRCDLHQGCISALCALYWEKCVCKWATACLWWRMEIWGPLQREEGQEKERKSSTIRVRTHISPLASSSKTPVGLAPQAPEPNNTCSRLLTSTLDFFVPFLTQPLLLKLKGVRHPLGLLIKTIREDSEKRTWEKGKVWEQRLLMCQREAQTSPSLRPCPSGRAPDLLPRACL